MVQQQQQFQQQFSRGTPSRPHSELSEFKRLNPATFNGIGGPIKAEDWIQEMEKTFDGMHCSEEDKVTCAAFMLKEGAYDWWLMEKRKHASDTVPYTWEMFKDAFYAKFFPRSEQIQREREISLSWSREVKLLESTRPNLHGCRDLLPRW